MGLQEVVLGAQYDWAAQLAVQQLHSLCYGNEATLSGRSFP